MSIEFGIFDHIEASGDRPAEEIYEHRIAFLKRAEAGGFSAFHLAEHHGHRLSIAPTAAVFLAALARETTKMKLIPTVVCLPLHDPVRLFEDLAMVDVLSHGRLEIGVGKGITPFEHLQFGHEPDEASARAADILALLVRAWETGIMSSEGSAFYDFLELKLPWALKQKPHPPLWTAGNVEAAGTRGHNFVAPFTITEAVRGRYDQLRAASRLQPGHHNPHVVEPTVAQCQGVIIGATNEEAEAAARRVWPLYAQQLLQAHGRVPPHLQTGIADTEDTHLAASQLLRDPVDAGFVVCGDVERVRDYYLDRAREGFANHFIAMLPFGTMTTEETERTMDGFIDEIIPAVRDMERERRGGPLRIGQHVSNERQIGAALEGRVIEVHGLPVEVLEAGQGEPLVFLHGGGYVEGVDYLVALTDRFHVYAPLLPGYGRSEPNLALTSREAVTDHLRDVLDALGLGTVHLAGHSLGGWRAANFAARYPGRVDRLVLASPFGMNVPGHPIFNMMAATPAERREVLTYDPSIWVGRIPTGPDPDPAFDEARTKEHQAMARFSPGAADAALPEIAATITTDTLVIWGEGDRLIPAAHAPEWVKLLPKATSRTFEGAGHLLFHERPEAVEAIAEFLQ